MSTFHIIMFVVFFFFFVLFTRVEITCHLHHIQSRNLLLVSGNFQTWNLWYYVLFFISSDSNCVFTFYGTSILRTIFFPSFVIWNNLFRCMNKFQTKDHGSTHFFSLSSQIPAIRLPETFFYIFTGQCRMHNEKGHYDLWKQVKKTSRNPFRLGRISV